MCPDADGELGDVDARAFGRNDHGSTRPKRVLLWQILDSTTEATVPRGEGGGRAKKVAASNRPAAFNKVGGVVARDGSGPSSSNAKGSVDEHRGDDGDKHVRLNRLSLLFFVLENRIIILDEEGAGNGVEPGEDIASGAVNRRRVKATTKLSFRAENVDVADADVVLCHSDDGFNKGLFAVMVHGFSGDFSGDLSNLDVVNNVFVKKGEEGFALNRFESVDDTG